MVKTILACFVLTFTPFLFPPASHADETPHGWRILSKTTSVDVRGSAQADVVFTSLNLRMTDPDQPEVRFSCSEEFGLRVTLLMQPLSEGILHGGRHVKAKPRFSRIAIEGREAERVRWVHVKEVRALQTATQKTAKMIYNAAVQGKTFTVKEPLKKDVVFDMPPMDAAFKRFAKQCGVTNGSS